MIKTLLDLLFDLFDIAVKNSSMFAVTDTDHKRAACGLTEKHGKRGNHGRARRVLNERHSFVRFA
jgi:hypothetical protein